MVKKNYSNACCATDRKQLQTARFCWKMKEVFTISICFLSYRTKFVCSHHFYWKIQPVAYWRAQTLGSRCWDLL